MEEARLEEVTSEASLDLVKARVRRWVTFPCWRGSQPLEGTTVRDQLSAIRRELACALPQNHQPVARMYLAALPGDQPLQAIDSNNILKEKMKMKQSIEDLLDKLGKREKDVSSMSSQIELLKTQIVALEHKSKSSEKKADATTKEKAKLEMELEALTRKSHDASGQLVIISQELLKKE
eukprot:g46257.t1